MSDREEPNRLAAEVSPYLLQHARNPVDWYPWGPEALERARAERRPIFLSIGYSACHWCHVMAHESFENEAIAACMNEHFVNVKVDREERPDLDEIYIKAVQLMTGSAGWPLSVFLTPELEPFNGGTYFPPYGVHGRPGFIDVLTGIAAAWERDSQRLVTQARRWRDKIADEGGPRTGASVDPGILDRSLEMLRRSFDPTYGGFGDAPKFPHATDIRLCLRHAARTGREADLFLATRSLDGMAAGGIHDQLGGGFHRYSTDEEWCIPHFEKMLYDNALLVPAYLEGYLVTGDATYADVARRTLDWALSEMRTPGGGFASSQDADSEGVEGRFFAWTPEELGAALGPERGYWAQEWFDVTDEGTFEHGASVLRRRHGTREVAARVGLPPADLERAMDEARGDLLAARARRVPPGTDDKVLAAWNGLMISALAMGHQVLGDERYLTGARSAASYVLRDMRRADGKLAACARADRVRHEACLDDYAFMIQASIDLYETDFDEEWLRVALALDEVLEEDFVDAEGGGYYTTGVAHEKLIVRLKSPHDGALPSGAGVHALNLLRLAELTGRGSLAKRAERTIVSLGALVNRYPSAFGALLMAVDFVHAGPFEVVLAGERGSPALEDLLRAVRGTFAPRRIVALAHAKADEGLIPLVADRTDANAAPRAYLCRSYACQAPLDDPEALRAALTE